MLDNAIPDEEKTSGNLYASTENIKMPWTENLSNKVLEKKQTKRTLIVKRTRNCDLQRLEGTKIMMII